MRGNCFAARGRWSAIVGRASFLAYRIKVRFFERFIYFGEDDEGDVTFTFFGLRFTRYKDGWVFGRG